MTGAPQHILSYFEGSGLLTAADKVEEGLRPIHATLKLWGSRYVRCLSLHELESRLSTPGPQGSCSAVVVDTLRPDIFKVLARRAPRCEVILVTSEEMLVPESHEEMTSIVNHYVGRSQGALATISLISALKKSSNEDIFGVEKYLSYGTPVHFFALSRSEERTWLVESLTEFVKDLDGVIPSGAGEFARMAGDVLDEFLMNAIWDANPARSKIDRSIPVFLKPAEAVRIEWGVDGNVLALSVTDPFGTLRREMLSKYHDEVLALKGSKNVIKINKSGPGAGLGLHMVLRRVSGVAINVRPGSATEFIALFDITRSPRYLSRGPKIFHFFSTSE